MSALFRNLTLFRFPAAIVRIPAIWRPDDVTAFDGRLAEHQLTEPGPLELSSRGFVSPFARSCAELVCAAGHNVLFALGGFDRILPSAVVHEVLAKKLDALREREGRNPGGRERKRLKDEVLTDLIPRAFLRPGRTLAYFDLTGGWLVVDTTARRVAEDVVSALREALGSFPALPVNPEESPRAIFTSWIAGEALPDGFVLGDECELRDPVDGGAVVKCSRQDLESDEIRQHLQAGKVGFRVALTYRDRLSFVLGEDMVVRKLRFLDAATAELDSESDVSVYNEVSAQFAILCGELHYLLQALESTFSLSAAD